MQAWTDRIATQQPQGQPLTSCAPSVTQVVGWVLGTCLLDGVTFISGSLALSPVFHT
jgi:hypothetical protein